MKTLSQKYKIVLEELIHKVNKNLDYYLYEFFFIQIKQFINKIKIPSYNDDEYIKKEFNMTKGHSKSKDKYITIYFQYILYRDYMNNKIYLDNKYQRFYKNVDLKLINSKKIEF